ncbi:MAG: hypothetical protein V1827_03655 [Candidatus Micrarchaeota archaeon]
MGEQERMEDRRAKLLAQLHPQAGPIAKEAPKPPSLKDVVPAMVGGRQKEVERLMQVAALGFENAIMNGRNVPPELQMSYMNNSDLRKLLIKG